MSIVTYSQWTFCSFLSLKNKSHFKVHITMGNYSFHVEFMHTCIGKLSFEGHKYKQKEVA
jgi:hypothetical protein